MFTGHDFTLESVALLLVQMRIIICDFFLPFQTCPLRVRVPPPHRRAEGGADVPQRDQMGEEHHVRRAAGLPALLVVVSQKKKSPMVGSSKFKPTHLFSVFWDLYCAAPERRETCDHSSEAKAFHDYVSTTCKSYFLLKSKKHTRYLFLGLCQLRLLSQWNASCKSLD